MAQGSKVRDRTEEQLRMNARKTTKAGGRMRWRKRWRGERGGREEAWRR
jgi:hypothetical protein